MSEFVNGAMGSHSIVSVPKLVEYTGMKWGAGA